MSTREQNFSEIEDPFHSSLLNQSQSVLHQNYENENENENELIQKLKNYSVKMIKKFYENPHFLKPFIQIVQNNLAFLQDCIPSLQKISTSGENLTRNNLEEACVNQKLRREKQFFMSKLKQKRQNLQLKVLKQNISNLNNYLKNKQLELPLLSINKLFRIIQDKYNSEIYQDSQIENQILFKKKNEHQDLIMDLLEQFQNWYIKQDVNVLTLYFILPKNLYNDCLKKEMIQFYPHLKSPPKRR